MANEMDNIMNPVEDDDALTNITVRDIVGNNSYENITLYPENTLGDLLDVLAEEAGKVGNSEAANLFRDSTVKKTFRIKSPDPSRGKPTSNYNVSMEQFGLRSDDIILLDNDGSVGGF